MTPKTLHFQQLPSWVLPFCQNYLGRDYLKADPWRSASAIELELLQRLQPRETLLWFSAPVQGIQLDRLKVYWLITLSLLIGVIYFAVHDILLALSFSVTVFYTAAWVGILLKGLLFGVACLAFVEPLEYAVRHQCTYYAYTNQAFYFVRDQGAISYISAYSWDMITSIDVYASDLSYGEIHIGLMTHKGEDLIVNTIPSCVQVHNLMLKAGRAVNPEIQ